MPYEREWRDNERAFTFMGIPVYHAYKDDEAGEILDYWFHISAAGNQDEAFDARDLPREAADYTEFLTRNIEDIRKDRIDSIHRRVAAALWLGLLIPPRYSEQFVLAKIQYLLSGDSSVTKETLGILLIELLDEYKVVPGTGLCEFMPDEEIGLKAEED